ncbi:MAG TPA: histidine phosphatase family protein [Caulobacteraceae bacterium]|nr:histidine phosphatase family protein [Caulobacteraceae bacterium]
MDRLILLRHGKAEANAPSGKDFDRVLTERGRRDTLMVVRALVEAGFVPDVALVSPAARARDTWAAAAEALPGTTALFEPALYNAEPDVIWAQAQDKGQNYGAVLIVAHNPGLHQLAATLAQRCSDAPDRIQLNAGFPTSAAAAFDFQASRFVLFTAKGLGGGAGGFAP